jgi:2'-5' RNA ligase
MEFTRFGMFYKEKNPSILWLGTQKSFVLNDLFKDLENGLFPLGVRKENREFKPHLTILRIKGKENFAGLKGLTEQPGLALKFNAMKIILFKSSLLKTGSVYEEVESFLLK